MTALATYGAIAREVFEPREILSPSAWAERHYRVTTGDFRGPFSLDRTPYLRGLLDAIADPAVRVVAVKKGSQVGGTLALRAALFWWVDSVGGTCMYVLPKDDAAGEQCKLRILPAVEACDPIRARIITGKGESASKLLRFSPATDIVFRGAMTERNLESLDADLVYVDEVDRCPPRTCHLAKQRGKTLAQSKVVLCGKPGLAGEGVDREYDLSDRRRYLLPCPACGVYHERTFARVRWHGRNREGEIGWDSRDLTSPAQVVRETACLRCPNLACRARIGPDANLWQLSLGVWAAQGQSVAPLRPRLTRRGVQPGPDAPPADRWHDTPGTLGGKAFASDQAGFHVPELISGVAVGGPYAGVAGDFVERGGVMDADVLADRLGLAYSPVSRPPEVSQLRKATCGENPLHAGQVPDEAVALIAAVDVQIGHAFVAVTAYAARMRTRWLVWYEQVPCPEGTGLATLDELLYRRVFTRQDGAGMRVVSRGIDSGDRTAEVYDYCRARPQCYAIKGVGEDPRGRLDTPHQWRLITLSPDGRRKLEPPVSLLKVNAHHWRSWVLRRLGIDAGEKDPALLDEDEPERTPGETVTAWRLPRDVTDEYLEQLTAEELVETRGPGGRVKHEWRLRPGRRHNHWFDVAVYTEALAHARGVHTLDRPCGLETPKLPRTPAPPPRDTARRSTPLLDRARARRS